MNVKEAYDNWASQYDKDFNKTRDLEAISLRESLKDIHVDRCLEIGCGTGKNTSWLAEHAEHVTAVDFSEEMLAVAREKIKAGNVEFVRADITNEWSFATKPYDLVTFSLILEHISNIENIFRVLRTVVKINGLVYIGELHPFKQYSGSKARFENAEGLHVLPCFNHHISDFTGSAVRNGFHITEIREYFDEAEKHSIPRVLSLIFTL
jgi:ubiquinone/menaquinone biosynthesis C-methylase UbiE